VEKIRAEPALAHLPIVVITSGGERERQLLAGLGVPLFLRKPVSYQDLAGAIRTLLGSRLAATRRATGVGAEVPVGEAQREGLTSGEAVDIDPADAMPASRR
jgi:DNA-binding response OmpR family regulator